MRILQCIWQVGRGGAEKQLVYLTRGLVRRGSDVHVAIVRREVLAGELERAGAGIHELGGSKHDPRVFLRLVKLIRFVRPDVMNTWLTAMDIVGGLAAVATSIPWALSERSAAAAYPPSVLNRVRDVAGRRAHAIIANSEGGAGYWRARRGDRGIFVVPNVTAADEADSSGYQPGDLSLESGEKVVLFVGRLSPEKNIPTIIAAAAQAMRKREFLFVICGEGPLRGELEALAVHHGIGDRTHFIGAVDSVFPWMKRADVLVAASAFEGSPNVVQEAIACRTPLVLGDMEAYRSAVNGDTARWVDRNSPASVAAGIVDVLEDGGAAALRAARAHAALRIWSSDEIAGRYEEIYRLIGSST